MPREHREIIFSLQELESAVRSYARVTPRFLPVGEQIACSPDASGGLAITVHATYGATVQEMVIEVRPEDIEALLIRFCLENNVMLPRAGQKRVVGHEDGLALFIDLEQAMVPS
jgi:hypothetical protein